MINYNKLYSGLFSIILIYFIMSIFELIFFIFIVCPLVSSHIQKLLDVYKTRYSQNINKNNPQLMAILNIINKREYILIDKFNFNNYIIIIIMIILLLSLLFYLYLKIGVIDNIGHTEHSENNSEFEFEMHNIVDDDLRSVVSVASEKTESQNTNISRQKIKFLYLKHAIKCAISTIFCLIIFQIFFYFYGLSFKYIGSTEEFIVIFIENIT